MDRNAFVSHPPVDTEERLRGFRGKRVLVTGGAGFVGSNLAARLVKLGAEVVVLDDLSTGQKELLPTGLVGFIHGSVTNDETVCQLSDGAGFVFHLAVQNIVLSTAQLRQDLAVNIGGTLNVLMAAAKQPVPPRVIYTSSASVYGNPRILPIAEDEGVSILSPYAASKLAGESYCSAFFEMYQLPVSVVRYSNVYGINQSPRNPYCGVISKFFESCQAGQPLKIHGTGLQTRDFTYVADAVEATLLAAVTPRAEGQVFNVGSGRETTIRDLAGLVSDVVGIPCEVEYVDRRDIDNVSRRVMNVERARRVLRWVPNTPIDQGLRLTHDWFKAHGAGAS